jgi:hypothetical protein
VHGQNCLIACDFPPNCGLGIQASVSRFVGMIVSFLMHLSVKCRPGMYRSRALLKIRHESTWSISMFHSAAKTVFIIRYVMF